MNKFFIFDTNTLLSALFDETSVPAMAMNDPGASCRGIEYKMQPTHKYKQPPRSKLRGILSIKKSKAPSCFTDF